MSTFFFHLKFLVDIILLVLIIVLDIGSFKI